MWDGRMLHRALMVTKVLLVSSAVVRGDDCGPRDRCRLMENAATCRKVELIGRCPVVVEPACPPTR